MKKILFYTFLAITIKAYTQGNLPTLYLLHPDTHLFSVQNTRILEAGNTIFDSFPETAFPGNAKKQVGKQASAIQIFDSIYNWVWDTTQNFGWKYKYKTVEISYDSNTKLGHQLTQVWYGNKWIDGNRHLLCFDANHNLISMLEQLWYNNAWENYSQSIFTYDANDNNTGRLSSNWNSSTNEWRNREQYLNTFDANNNCLSQTYQTWFMNAWLNDRRTIYVYYTENNLASAKDQKWNGSSWNDQRLRTYTYNVNNKVIHILEQGYTSDGLIDIGKYGYSYDANNNLIYGTYTDFDGSAWKEITQNFYTYDDKNNLINQLDKNWNWTENAMLKTREYNTTYDKDNFKQSFMYKYCNSSGTNTSGDSTYYYFHTQPLGINVSPETNIILYPNPGNGKFTIYVKNHFSSVDVFNMQGVCIYAENNLNQQTSKEMDLSNSTKGMYLVRVSCSEGIYTQKILIK